jgi:hypothetical protein
MALSKIDVANMLTGATPTANGGTGSTASTLPASLIDNTSIGNVTSLPAAIATGKVLQVVSVQDLTVRSTTSTSFTKASNGYDLNITPTASNSNILLEASFGGGIDATSNRCWFTIYRDSTNIGTGDGVTTHEISDGGNARSSELRQHLLVTDSPNTTSQITYSIQMKGQGGNTVYMNQKGVGSFVAYEIAG